MAFHDVYEYPGKKAIHEKLIQSDTVSEHNLSVTTNGNKAVINPQQTRPMRFIISYEYIPAETKFTFANGETARVNWTLHLRYHTTPLCSTNIDVLEQGTVPILLSISQMRNLYMTIEHTPQCDKITCKAFGMNCQAVPVSGTGHALVDLAGVARVKAHGEIAHKGLTHYVYDDDNSIKFPSRGLTKSEAVCAAKSSETKEDLTTPKRVSKAGPLDP